MCERLRKSFIFLRVQQSINRTPIFDRKQRKKRKSDRSILRFFERKKEKKKKKRSIDPQIFPVIKNN